MVYSIINTFIQDSTGKVPNELVFGAKLKSIVDCFDNLYSMLHAENFTNKISDLTAVVRVKIA